MFTKSYIRYSIAIIALVFLLTDVSFALNQRWKLRRYEVGGGLGMTQVFGDIGGTADKNNLMGLKDIKFDETRMAFDMFVRYKIDPVYSVKVNAIAGFGHASDANTLYPRGREYKTRLFELSAQGEYYFLGEEKRFRSAAMFNRRGMLNNYASISAYGFLGLGMIYSNAKFTYAEGFDPAPEDKVKKNNMGAVMPFGLGVKYIIDDRWLVNAELGYRISFTDYIEGYSQTKDSKHKDVYYFLTISVSYRLDTSRRGLPAMLDKEYRRSNR
jgi:hypothetical protein